MKIKEILDYGLPDFLAFITIAFISIGFYYWQGFERFVLFTLTWLVYKVMKLDSPKRDNN